MTDVAFVVREDEILARKASALREVKLRRLEFQALYETCHDECQTPAWAHLEHIWGTGTRKGAGRLSDGR